MNLIEHLKMAMNNEIDLANETYDEIKASVALAGILKRQYYTKMFNELFEEIKHGDEAHQLWLKLKIESFKNRQLE